MSESSTGSWTALKRQALDEIQPPSLSTCSKKSWIIIKQRLRQDNYDIASQNTQKLAMNLFVEINNVRDDILMPDKSGIKIFVCTSAYGL